MKQLVLSTLVLFLIAVKPVLAQKGEAVTPSFFSITFSEEVYGVVSPNATLGNMTDGWSDALKYDETADAKTSNPAAYFHYKVNEKIKKLTYDVFLEKLDITINPLTTLSGKISYSGQYPSEYKFKNVLKKAPGQDYYLFFKVYMYKGGVAVGNVSLGGKLKPTTAITLVIADSNGKEIQEFEVKEKTDISVGERKASIGDVEMGKGEDPDEVMTKVMQVYENALNVLVDDYLSKNKKAYK